MRAGILLLVLVNLTACVLASPDEQRLYSQLLENYNKMVRPVNHASQNVTVTTNIALERIVKFDPHTQEFVIIFLSSNKWYDPQLRWDPAQFGGVSSIPLPKGSVWMPDITALNLNEPSVEIVNGRVVVWSDGTVMHFPYMRQNLICATRQEDKVYKCEKKLGSWAYNGYQLDIVVEEQKLSDSYTPNHDWEIVKFETKLENKYYACCKEPYPTLTSAVYLKKREAAPMMEEESSGEEGSGEHHTSHEAESHEDAEHHTSQEAESHEDAEHHTSNEAESHEDAEHHKSPQAESHEDAEHHTSQEEANVPIEGDINYIEDKVADKEKEENEVKFWFF